jgi:hypothetical protein
MNQLQIICHIYCEVGYFHKGLILQSSTQLEMCLEFDFTLVFHNDGHWEIKHSLAP